MREIKFRAWDGEAMIMLPLVGLQYFDFEGSYALSFAVDGYDGFWAHEQYDTMSSKASGFPIMQYTGLKDKNGIEIYDSDMLKRRVVDFKEDGGYMDMTCEVRWNGWCFSLFIADKQMWGLDPIVARECEITGNIYEN